MNVALRTMLDGVIDYAGLFPPARLPLEEAARNYAKYRRSDDAWMLRHFVVPIDRLDELAGHIGDEPQWSLSVLGNRCEAFSSWRDTLREDIRQCADFQSHHGEQATVDAMELAIPGDDSSNDAEQVVRVLVEECLNAEFPLENVFLEVPPGPRASEVRRNLAVTIADAPSNDVPIGLKLRTGGLDAAAFPTSEELAEFILMCQNHRVIWKATAGLHHPLPRFDSETGATMHGFLNLLCAVVLGETVDMSALLEILSDQDPTHFVFTEDGLSWREFHANREHLLAARQRFISFGSCSFDEPREDLKQLGYSITTSGSVAS